VSKNSLARFIMTLTAWPTCLPCRPMAKATLRAWKPSKPLSGAMGSLMIFSGVLAATSSMSMPPSLLAMSTGQPWARSTTMPSQGGAVVGQLLKSACGLIGGVDHHASGHGDVERLEQLAGLVFVDLHGGRIAVWGREGGCQGPKAVVRAEPIGP